MAIAPLDIPRHRFTADEVLRMVDVGILTKDDRLELLDGELIVVSPQGSFHSALTARIHRLLEGVFGAGFHARDHSPLHLGPHDLPEPDVAIVRGEADDYLHRHPGGADVVLVVEVAVSSLRADRAKATLYARAGVPEYWLVDVEGREVVVHRHPDAADYAAVATFEEIASVAVGGGSVAVARLLP